MEIYAPFCTSASKITQGEAIDAISDHLYASKYPEIDRVDIMNSLRAKFCNTEALPFWAFIALQACDFEACAPFWSDEIQSMLQDPS